MHLTGLPCNCGGSTRGLASAFLACAFVLATPPARPTDLVEATLPLEVKDMRLTIGKRSLMIPDGRWFAFARETTTFWGGGMAYDVPADSVITIDADGDQFAMGLTLTLSRGDVPRHMQHPGRCGYDNEIYHHDRNGFSGIDCITIRGVYEQDFKAFTRKARELGGKWLEDLPVAAPGPTIAVTFNRISTTTMGRINLILPAEHFSSDAEAVAWAEGLRTSLKPLFEHAVDEGRLPPLPARTAPAASSAGGATGKP
jgi:hypothetical protein